MADDSTGNPSLGQKVKHGFESKVLVPLAVTIVSAAVSYLAKKLPMLLEERVLPKLQEGNAPEPVANVVEQAVGVMGGDSGASTETEETPQASDSTDDERENARREREERRRERKRSIQKAA